MYQLRKALRRTSSAAFGLLLGTVSAIMSTQAQAACSQWDIPATMLINQSNDTVLTIHTSPVEGGFLGTAESKYLNSVLGLTMPGVLEGAVEGSNVTFTIHWHANVEYYHVPSRTGVYTGTVGPQGRLTGTAYKAENPAETATWWVEEVVRCHAGAASTPPEQIVTPLRPPPVPLGRVHPTQPPVPLGRVQSTSSVPGPLERKQVPMSVILAPPPICVAAQNARARNSPAAPGLERQCQIAMERATSAAR